MQSVSLLDTSTFEATFSRDAGSLVPQASKLRSLRAAIKRRIDELAGEGRILPEQRTEIRAAWDAFETDYAKAVNDFVSVGLHGEAVLRQADSFAALLRSLTIHARGDVCRARLVSEVLTIGTVRVAGNQPSLIIPPWHPERMKALAVKTRRVAGLVAHILAGKNVLFGDRGAFLPRVLRGTCPRVLSGDRRRLQGRCSGARQRKQYGQWIQPFRTSRSIGR